MKPPVLKAKPLPPHEAVWDKVKRPGLVSKLVLFAAGAYAVSFATTGALLYVLLRWLFFPAWPLASGALISAIVGGCLGYSLGFYTAVLAMRAAMSLKQVVEDQP